MTIRVKLVYKILGSIRTHRTTLLLQIGDILYPNEKFSRELNEMVYNYKVGNKFLKIVLEE